MKAKAFALFLSGVAVGLLPAVEFDKPVMLKAGGKPIRVESPGYACPAWADLDGDGTIDLLGTRALVDHLHRLCRVVMDHSIADEAIAYPRHHGRLLDFLGQRHGSSQHIR